ncbi:class I SAM-dependent methyltransferase [Streptomyces sp. WAC 00631]|uniref:class I SAM-dependent methyltransferase n=1 Tax=Streptomyces sp. WAC 00631 TaxID=2203201 RepID=UPI001C8B319F|nr:class I SAM-dependent methyltransferase [Streptomyces sp. WAC 00631]MCC5036583.1 class I SAM-dependent methyltransferase [Streptomyces sp. WAC 00631]
MVLYRQQGGLSTWALRDRAHRVVAFDVSPAMLAEAPRFPGAHYLVAAAERIPLRDAAADLATVGAAFHWFDQPAAFAELARVLRPGGQLAVYSDFFLSRIEDIPDFATWFQQTYLPGYPNPRRHGHFDPGAAVAAGFAEVTSEQAEFPVPLTRRQLADFLLSQSNAGAAIGSGATTEARLAEELAHELAQFVPDGGTARVLYGIRTWTTTRLS